MHISIFVNTHTLRLHGLSFSGLAFGSLTLTLSIFKVLFSLHDWKTWKKVFNKSAVAAFRVNGLLAFSMMSFHFEIVWISHLWQHTFVNIVKQRLKFI